MKFDEFINDKDKYKKIFESYDDDDDNNDQWEPEPAPILPIPKKIIKNKNEDDEDDSKNQKVFKVGDEIVLVNTKRSNKIPDDAWDFLLTFKSFIVRKVNDKGKIDIGCNISKNTDGGVEKTYMFSPNRFELKNATK